MPTWPEPKAPQSSRAMARELFAQPRISLRPGLMRMERLVAPFRARPWWQGLDAIRITGSNGKGTVATLVEAILREHGLRTGLYTSPHLRRFEERFRIDGREATGAMLAKAMEDLRPRLSVRGGDPPLAFEAMTALALGVFEAENVDVAVVEAGIGGRYDATRLIPGSIGVLTSVDLEHTALLGESLESIAEDKADLMVPAEGAEPGGGAARGTLLVGDVGAGPLESVRRGAGRRGVEILPVGELAEWSSPRPRRRVSGALGMVFDLALRQSRDLPVLAGLEVALAAPHQAQNVALAVLAAELWLRRYRPSLPPSPREGALRRALATVHLEGRFARARVRTASESEPEPEPEVWVDIAHTPAAARASAETIRWHFGDPSAPRPRPVILVLGVSADKDAGGIVGSLAVEADYVVCTRARHRGGEVERVARQVGDLGVQHESVHSLGAALETALARAGHLGGVVVVTGGLFLAMEAAELLEGGDPGALEFY